MLIPCFDGRGVELMKAGDNDVVRANMGLSGRWLTGGAHLSGHTKKLTDTLLALEMGIYTSTEQLRVMTDAIVVVL